MWCEGISVILCQESDTILHILRLFKSVHKETDKKMNNEWPGQLRQKKGILNSGQQKNRWMNHESALEQIE